MIAAGRIGLVAALITAMGIVSILNPDQAADSSPHGCSDPPATLPLAGAFSAALPSQDTPHTELFDDFQGAPGAPPDPAKWTVIEGAGWDRGDQKYARENAVLDGEGHLVLRAEQAGGGHASGRVETRRKAAFGYGTLIARIKMPAGKGLWPAFWLMGADEDNRPWPEAGEIDVVELVSDPRRRYSSLHGPIPDVKDHLQAQVVGDSPDLSADFHDYWVIREPDRVIVGIDDIVWADFTPKSLPPNASWVFNKPFCVILNLAVGGDWAGPPDGSTVFPAAMLVDWVHWQPAV
ncbi:MAG: glycoside hydrolase family 16 protein [Mycobacterium sp.]|nr:glycoside hydrolase family 16 protein [Mycobacterium sp.]